MAPPTVCVFSALNITEAHMAKQLLDGIGVPCELRGMHRAGLGGLIPMQDAAIEVWVRMQDAREARQALGVQTPVADGKLSLAPLHPDAGALSAPSDEPDTCPECGEDWEPDFEVCWSCQWERPT